MDNKSAIDNDRISRHVGRSWITEALAEIGTLAFGMIALTCAGMSGQLLCC
ncbi:hypothetical protein [Erwinia amylovora]|uniref:hypothetical protein n=1 Tax=Erwinia amylovora TaxID=552 RepID=UPI0015D4CE2B|nr:hypothetical protein [Erwinia amylovora]